MQATAYIPGTTGGRREDLRNVLTILEPEETPFTSMIRKGPAPKSTFVETLGDTLRTPKAQGTKPGTDAIRGANKAANRARFGTYICRQMESFGVDDVQQIISEKGGQAAVTNEYANAKAKTIREMKRDIETMNLGSQEHTGGDDDTEMMTRGAFKWIQYTAQSSNAVPASFRSVSAAVLSGVTALTEAQLYGVLKALKGVYGVKKTYTGIGGDTIIEYIDNFTRVNSTTDLSKNRYQVTEEATTHEITMMVTAFDCSFGRVELMNSSFINCTAGVPDPYMLGLFNMDLWHMDLFDPLHAMDLPNLGGGPNGYAKNMHALLCDSPRGNGKIYNS